MGNRTGTEVFDGTEVFGSWSTFLNFLRKLKCFVKGIKFNFIPTPILNRSERRTIKLMVWWRSLVVKPARRWLYIIDQCNLYLRPHCRLVVWRYEQVLKTSYSSFPWMMSIVYHPAAIKPADKSELFQLFVSIYQNNSNY